MNKVNKKVKKTIKLIKKIVPKISIKNKPKTKVKIKPKSIIKFNTKIASEEAKKPKSSGLRSGKIILDKEAKKPKSRGLRSGKTILDKETKKSKSSGLRSGATILDKEIKKPKSRGLRRETTVIKKADKINMSQINNTNKSNNLNYVVDKPYSFQKEEEYMNEEQVEHFKKILLTWKEGLMESVDNTMHHMQDEAANYPDPVDRASQEEGFSLELRTRDRERKLLKKIDETLLRISEQDYGYCDDCGAEIGIRRLEARPTANQCIECKTIAEIREKQIGEIN